MLCLLLVVSGLRFVSMLELLVLSLDWVWLLGICFVVYFINASCLSFLACCTRLDLC